MTSAEIDSSSRSRSVPSFGVGWGAWPVTTFTDFSLLDEETGRLAGFKWPSVPADPARGVIDGLRALAGELRIDPAEIVYLVHGTTIAVNTVIQRNGAALGLLVTEGFGDVLELQRLRLDNPVNFTATRPAPLIPRYRVGGVRERILADGTVETPLDADGLLAEAQRLVEREGVEGLVCSPAGGGYGDPRQRDPERVRADVRAAFLTEAQAREQYGVVLADGKVDAGATARARAQMPAPPTPFDVGDGRAALERRWPPELQDATVRLLDSLPPHVRDWGKHQIYDRIQAVAASRRPTAADVDAAWREVRSRLARALGG